MRFFGKIVKAALPLKSGAIAAGLLTAALAGGAALPAPARAQAVIQVVDSQGRPVGVLLKTPGVAALPSGFASPMAGFEALDRMMARQMAAMEEEQKQMIALMNQGSVNQAAATHAVDVNSVHGRAAPGGSVYQSVTMISWSGNGATCAQTVTQSQNGNAAPVVHVSATGSADRCGKVVSGRNIPEMAAPSGAARHPDLVPAVDRGPAALKPDADRSDRL